MKSFPSSFTKDDLVQPGKTVTTNLQTTLKNIAGSIMQNSLGGSGEVSKSSLGENLSEAWSSFEYNDALSRIDFGSNVTNYDATHRLYDKVSANGAFHENARKIPALTLASINKYRKIFNYTAGQLCPPSKGKDGTFAYEYYSEAVSPSLFGGLYGVRSQGMTINTPLMHSASIDYSSIESSNNKSSVTNAEKDKENLEKVKNIATKNVEGEIKRIQNELKALNAQGNAAAPTKDDGKYKKENGKLTKEAQQQFEEDTKNWKEAHNKAQSEISETKKALEAKQKELEELKNKIDSAETTEELKKLNAYTTLSDRPNAFTEDIDSSAVFVQLNNDDYDFTDCSIKTLVKLSNGIYGGDGATIPARRSLGRATYRYADFMFCKDLGKISNNHLITLRKFPFPIGDNIFRLPTKQSEREIGAVGKLISWFGTEDNKLEDICKYEYSASWKELTAKLEDVNSKEDQSGILPSVINMLNPSYNNFVAGGFGGDNNRIYNWVAGNSKILSNTSAYGDILSFRDENKVYEPKNTIQSTHIYEGKLQFSHEFTLTFCYKLRAYDGINPKSAFLDLLGNILAVTYKDGVFWGGAKRWIGAPRNNKGWKKAQKIFDAVAKGIDGGIEDLFGCSSLSDLMSLCGSWLGAAGEFLKGAVQKAEETVTSGDFKDKAKGATKEAAKVLQGMLKNKLGRPAMYATNSLLSGANVGLWHVTIGNPRNPIMSMGNLILTKSTIQHSGPLGIDDFPTDIKVTVTLKHARPRDARAIGEMYTCGEGSLILPLTDKKIEKFLGQPDFANYEALGLNAMLDETTDSASKIDAESINTLTNAVS